jgi:hypothetical protein
MSRVTRHERSILTRAPFGRSSCSQFLTSNRVSFADCVEKSDLQKRVQETLAKQRQQPQAKTCDCMQTGPHTHAAPSDSKPKVPKTDGGEWTQRWNCRPRDCSRWLMLRCPVGVVSFLPSSLQPSFVTSLLDRSNAI